MCMCNPTQPREHSRFGVLSLFRRIGLEESLSHRQTEEEEEEEENEETAKTHS